MIRAERARLGLVSWVNGDGGWQGDVYVEGTHDGYHLDWRGPAAGSEWEEKVCV